MYLDMIRLNQTQVVQHPCGPEIRYRYLTHLSNGTTVALWSVSADSCFGPETRNYDIVVTVLEGMGIVLIGDEEEPYHPGMTTHIPAGTKACIKQAGTDTTVLQCNFPTLRIE